jgi:hypothetical protein
MLTDQSAISIAKSETGQWRFKVVSVLSVLSAGATG